MLLVFEAIIVGILTVIFGYLGSAIATPIAGVKEMPQACKEWNKNYIMELSLFFTGFLFHSALDIAGFNKMYCDSKKEILN